MKKETGKKSLKHIFPFLLVSLGTIGFIMSFIIMVEKIMLLQNSAYKPPCSINPIISCGSVMQSPQAAAFGFPNPFLGLAGFSVIVTVGMALFAGASFKRWFWLGLEAGTLLGVAFIHWLFYQSVFVINALCPYCMVVWAVTIALFLYITLYNFQEGYISLPASLKRVVGVIRRFHASVLLLWYLAILGAIVVRFWYFWKTLL